MPSFANNEDEKNEGYIIGPIHVSVGIFIN